MPYISEEQWKTLIYYAKRQFVYDLLLGNLQNVKAIWERMDSINISVMPKVAIALRLDNYYALTCDKSERWKHQFREKIWDYLEDQLPDWVLGVPFAENLIALLVPLKTSTYSENRAELFNLIPPWSKTLADQFGIKVIWGVGCVYNDPRLLHFSFQESIRILDHPEKYGQEICFAEPPCGSGPEEVLQTDSGSDEDAEDPFQRWPEWAKSRVIRKLEIVDCPGVILELKDVVEKQLSKFQSDDRNKFAPVIALELAMAILRDRDIVTDSSSNMVYAEIADYLASSDRVDVRRWLEKFGEDLIHWAKANGFSENPYVTRVKAFVEDHLEEELSLSHIAEIVHLTPSYLSQLFKKQTGEGLNDFVVKRRISKACRLLQTLSLPVSDIARKVGFQDVNYFTRVFKQRQHLTPLEFRKGAKQS
ncbi:helix-turn-helix domain-containing protein [Desulfosporosinus sp. OT]|uniref:helix-turn-helix domain-containing protein n=1 Tax=Desulfosporosinus sp. OT TaxID=913865 RepID=UPI000223A18D|nr:helix-turn-helix domain-containing protein [Desulfosporosinus sp. OT]EGW38497.1 bacterial regulatory helix-turn-helix s, AraC family protein [Desulfosporosinus sp. OT]